MVVLLSTLHVVLAHLPHILGQPHPARHPGLGRHGRHAHWIVRLRMAPLAFLVAIVGLITLSANEEVGKFAHLPAAEAVDDLTERVGFCIRNKCFLGGALFVYETPIHLFFFFVFTFRFPQTAGDVTREKQQENRHGLCMVSNFVSE